MLEEKYKSEDYSERLIPVRVTITRQRDNFTYVFEINGFKGERTGQIFYKGSDVLEVERFLETNEAIRQNTLSPLGLVLNFETPQAMVGKESSSSTGTMIASHKIFRLIVKTPPYQFV